MSEKNCYRAKSRERFDPKRLSVSSKKIMENFNQNFVLQCFKHERAIVLEEEESQFAIHPQDETENNENLFP